MATTGKARPTVLAEAQRAATLAICAQVPAAALSGLLLLVQLQDLVYLATVGGVPTVARAAEMNARVGSFGSFGWITFGLATVLLGRWYRAFAGIARRTGAAMLPVVRIPFLRGYSSLRALDAALDPDTIPEPPAQAEAGNVAGGYRTAAVKVQARKPLGAAPLLAWWLLWLGSWLVVLVRWVITVPSWTIAKALDAVGSGCAAGATALACLIIVRMRARLEERYRRAYPPAEGE